MSGGAWLRTGVRRPIAVRLTHRYKRLRLMMHGYVTVIERANTGVACVTLVLCKGRCEAAWLAGTGADFDRAYRLRQSCYVLAINLACVRVFQAGSDSQLARHSSAVMTRKHSNVLVVSVW